MSLIVVWKLVPLTGSFSSSESVVWKSAEFCVGSNCVGVLLLGADFVLPCGRKDSDFKYFGNHLYLSLVRKKSKFLTNISIGILDDD